MNRRWLLSIEPWQQYAHSQHEPCFFSIHLIQMIGHPRLISSDTRPGTLYSKCKAHVKW
ncbi:hypothetical protein TGAM01_v209988 [Trichoderma gamsii]|uniref:Uncharacterized protein n=1 Tax=Trichoderma gamsii TaxID=398673 RepID=A0A2P4ZA15_9HYPO|nr:hypothetical protein TGAM01_v209988 [Trichoderma gamsii]PON21140.1 hypothetical protein TGAM01_v209988 [Trichoderma gamsii]